MTAVDPVDRRAIPLTPQRERLLPGNQAVTAGGQQRQAFRRRGRTYRHRVDDAHCPVGRGGTQRVEVLRRGPCSGATGTATLNPSLRCT